MNGDELEGYTPIDPNEGMGVVAIVAAAIITCLVFGGGYVVGSWSARNVRASYEEAQVIVADQDKALQVLVATCRQAREVFNSRIDECGTRIAQTESRLALCRSFLESSQGPMKYPALPTSDKPANLSFPHKGPRP